MRRCARCYKRANPAEAAIVRRDAENAFDFHAVSPHTAAHGSLDPSEPVALAPRRLPLSPAKKLGKDANHANAAGEYLGALVWYGFLFDESPEKLAFVPAGVDVAFAAHLRQVAWQIVRETAPANAKVARGSAAVARE
ncbi:MAG: hypothetical protein Q7S40_34715 [Opitutaceae bacterium]|nr:hypothetical protein [Opitutaceae bacterium]